MSENTDGDEEMKSEMNLPEVLLLRKISSEMKVEPYSRLASLVTAVNLLESMIKKCQAGEHIPEHELVQTGSS